MPATRVPFCRPACQSRKRGTEPRGGRLVGGFGRSGLRAGADKAGGFLGVGGRRSGGWAEGGECIRGDQPRGAALEEQRELGRVSSSSARSTAASMPVPATTEPCWASR